MLGNQIIIVKCFVWSVSPKLAPHPFVQMFGEGFGQPVGEGLAHNAAIIVAGRFKLIDELIKADSCSYRKHTHVVSHPRFFWSNKIGQ